MNELSDEDIPILGWYQEGKCAICGRRPTQFRRLCIDHDHRTGEIRGLLCDYCNTTIGFLKDDADWLASAADYLKECPTRRLWSNARWWPDSPGAAGFDLRDTYANET